MALRFINFKTAVLSFVTVSVLFAACGTNVEEAEGEEDKDSLNSEVKINVGGEIFSVPSPIQTAVLIKQTGANYTKEILNPAKNVNNYTTNFQKALNLGVFGADLGYVTMYDQTQDAIAYMSCVKKMADELGVTGAFDLKLIDRFQKNIGNRDSLLVLVSTAYRSSDAYLKNNERNDISSLILAGGWIETLYFATSVAKTKNNPEVIKRIAEQKTSLESLVKLLNQHNSQQEYTELIDNLKDLQTVFADVVFTYHYDKPTVDPAKKLTIINSKTEVKITPDQIQTISQKIQAIRNQIVG